MADVVLNYLFVRLATFKRFRPLFLTVITITLLGKVLGEKGGLSLKHFSLMLI